jgi:thiosulfate/3-mercaptopyruvate sulfurtransferase
VPTFTPFLFRFPVVLLLTLASVVAGNGCTPSERPGDAPSEDAPAAQATAANTAPSSWDTFITAETLRDWKGTSDLVIVDARSPEKYKAGHIPGAINVPGSKWRTPSRKPGEGPSKYIFRTADGSPDVQRYERFLSQAGIGDDSRVVVYGSFGGNKTSTVPVMILRWLGHEKTYFLDGVGLKQWEEAGYEGSTTSHESAPATFTANADSNFVWNRKDVLRGIDKQNVVIVDTRSKAEYTGENPRDNERGGHVPGAVRVNYSDLMHWPDRTTLSPAKAQQVLQEKGLTGKEDTTYVLHCQTSTRVSENYLVMKDLGYENVAIYDASWHEWGNRADTPIVTGPERAPEQQPYGPAQTSDQPGSTPSSETSEV